MGSKKKNIVYSTNKNFEYEYEENDEKETLEPGAQDLRITLDRKQRKGKSVTLVLGFVGSNEDLESLGKLLKSKCGSGGTVKNGEILIQGDFREKVKVFLQKEGYRVKISGGWMPGFKGMCLYQKKNTLYLGYSASYEWYFKKLCFSDM